MNESPVNLEVRHSEAAHRFEASLGDQLAVLEYQRSGDSLLMPYTGVPPAFRGRGIAAKLTATALDAARADGLKVVPICWYVADFIRDHPEYHDLVDRRSS